MELEDMGLKITEADISEFENKIEGILSEDYKKFLLNSNGGYVKGFLVTPDFIEEDPNDSSKYMQNTSPDRFFDLDELNEEFDDNLDDPVLPSNYISIAYDAGGNRIALNINPNEDNGAIYFANHELYDTLTGYWVLTKINNSFSDFINSLHPYEE